MRLNVLTIVIRELFSSDVLARVCKFASDLEAIDSTLVPDEPFAD